MIFHNDDTICFDGRTIAVEITNTLRENTAIVFAWARPVRGLLPVLPKEFRTGLLISGLACSSLNEEI